MLDLGAGTLDVYANGRRYGRMVKQGLRPPLRWAVTVLAGCSSVSIDGPMPLTADGQPAYMSPTSHDDELPVGTLVEVEGRCGTYQSFKKNTFGANEHTILLDDGTRLSEIKLKERSWRFPLPPNGKWPDKPGAVHGPLQRGGGF